MKIGIFKNYVRKKMKFYKLDLKIGILENYLKMNVLTVKFENWNFGKLNFEMGVLTIKFENWNFEKLNFDIKKWRIFILFLNMECDL